MATALDLLEISQVKGVKDVILFNKEGTIVASSDHNPIKNQKNTQNFIINLISDCGNIATLVGSSRIIHIIISKKNRENIIAFIIGSHILGITKEAETDTSFLIKEVNRFMMEMKKRQTPQK